MKRDINFVITDLDDTIWDWLEMWYNSFNPYLERIAEETGLDIPKLKLAFKELHQYYGTTEMSFAYKELSIIPENFYPLFEDSNGTKRSILHEYNSNKKNNIKLYDSVIETLKTLKSKGSLIVAFTESYVFFTKYRIKHLNLDGLIDFVYSPRGTDLPLSVGKYYPDDHWEPKLTEFKILPTGTRKPNAEILEQIISDFKADKSKSFYIGDKLDRDIYMAQQAGITSVHAKYGHVIDNNKYELLREVTHWNNEDVKREIAFKSSKLNIMPPSYEIEKFDELLKLFEFKSFL